MSARRSHLARLAGDAAARPLHPLDKAIGYLFPGWAAKRHVARTALAVAGRGGGGYDAGKTSRLMDDWDPTVTSADSAAFPGLERIRERSRDLVRNEGHAKAVVSTRADNVVGPGIRVRSTATAEETGMDEAEVAAWNAACDQAFSEWAREPELCDATEHGHFGHLQRLAYASYRTDGECFARLVPKRGGLALELIAPERVDTPHQQQNGTEIRKGVELDAFGAAVAYWVRKSHPQDLVVSTGVTASSQEFDRITRRNAGLQTVMHYYRRERIGQSRGVPALAPVITTFDLLKRYLKSEQVAAALTSKIALFIKRSGELLEGPRLDWDNVLGSLVETWSPGETVYLGAGEEPFAFNPQRPGATFDPFMTRVLRAIAASQDLSYEQLVKDFSKTNYTSMRAALLETRRSFRCEQGELVMTLARPVRQTVLTHLFLTGRLPPVRDFMARRRALLRARWVPVAWGWVDPQREIMSSVLAIRHGLSTHADEAAGNAGNDFEDVARIKARELAFLRELEVEFGFPQGFLLTGTDGGSTGSSSPTTTGGQASTTTLPGGDELAEPDAPEQDDEDEQFPQPEDEDQAADARAGAMAREHFGAGVL